MIISNSIRQLFRTPVKTVLFLVLLTVSTVLVTAGANLFITGEREMQKLNDSFVTIGTVQQTPNMTNTEARWNPFRKEYSYVNRPVYDKEIPVSALDFEGANYLIRPEHRPTYGAWHESYALSSYTSDNALDADWSILEAEPIEDCVPSEPVRLRVKKILKGGSPYMKEFWFCDHWNEKPAPMFAGKTYILSLQFYPISEYPGFETSKELLYIPNVGVEGSQFNKNGAPIPDELGETQAGWEEVTEGYYGTPRGRRWQELIKAQAAFLKMIPVVPTNATHLLMDFFISNANIIEGRDITAEEYAAGGKVCLVSRGFARNNKLEIGDSFPLPLYTANYRSAPVRGGTGDTFLNARGKTPPVFEDGNYTVVGIYEAPGAGFFASDFGSGENMAVIPMKSVKNSDENNIVDYAPMRAYNTSFQIPNGEIENFTKAMSQAGIEGLEINFYDKGYTQLRDGFDRIQTLSVLLLIVGVTVTFFILLFFTYLFITKNKKRTAVERSLGFSRKECAVSLLSGMTALYAVGISIGSLFGALISIAATTLAAVTGNSQGAYDLRFSGWVNNADKLAREVAGASMLDLGLFLLIDAGIFTAGVIIALVGIYQNLKHEPLALLGERENG